MRFNVRSWVSLLGAAALSCLLLLSTAHAEEAAAETDDGRATSFQAVEGAVKEDVPGGPLLVGAYGFVWLAVLGYVWRLARLSARTEENLQLLQRALGSAAKGSSDPRG